MYTLFFTHQHRRSTKTLRLHYGLEGMKYIIQVYEGEINGHGEKEGLPIEYQYEFEQEMLKHIHNLNELREKRWNQRDLSTGFNSHPKPQPLFFASFSAFIKSS